MIKSYQIPDTKYQTPDRKAMNVLGVLFSDFIKVSSILTDVPIQSAKYFKHQEIWMNMEQVLLFHIFQIK